MNTASCSFTLGYSDCDALKKLKMSAYLRLCQELAENHCIGLGCGREQLLAEEGLVWVVLRNQTAIARLPAAGEKLTLETFTAPVRRFFFPRYFVLRDSEGKTLMESASYWTLLDAEKRVMVNSPHLKERDWDAHIAPTITRFMSPPEPDGEEKSLHRTAVYSDMDVNAHVNNTRYLDWLCDVLGTAALEEHPLKDFLIDYHHEVREGQDVALSLSMDQSCFILNGFENTMLLFTVCGHFAREENN